MADTRRPASTLPKPKEEEPTAANNYNATVPMNTDISARPYVQHIGGDVSTVYSMGMEDEKGAPTLVPTVSNYGYMMTPDQAAEEYAKTGKHLGKYRTNEASDKAGEAIHVDQMRTPPKDSLHGAGMLYNPDGSVKAVPKSYERPDLRQPPAKTPNVLLDALRKMQLS